MIGLIIFFAGAKEEIAGEPFADPRVAVGEELNMFSTFFELKRMLHNKKRIRFLEGLRRRKKTGSSGKELWRWIPGYEGKYKVSTKGRVRITVPMKKRKRIIHQPQLILSKKSSQKFLKTLSPQNPSHKEIVR